MWWWKIISPNPRILGVWDRGKAVSPVRAFLGIRANDDLRVFAEINDWAIPKNWIPRDCEFWGNAPEAIRTQSPAHHGRSCRPTCTQHSPTGAHRTAQATAARDVSPPTTREEEVLRGDAASTVRPRRLSSSSVDAGSGGSGPLFHWGCRCRE